MDSADALQIQQMLTKIMETDTISEQNINLLKHFSSTLLSNKSNEHKTIDISAEYQGMILLLCKFAILSPKNIPKPVFFFVFRLIIASTLHFYSNNPDLLTKFIAEIPHDFAESYFNSIKENYLGEHVDKELTNVSITSLLVFIYFSDPKAENPFSRIINELPKGFINDLEKHVAQQAPMILLRAYLVKHCKKLTDEEFEWIPACISEINSMKRIESELRIDIILIALDLINIKMDGRFISFIIWFIKSKPTESIAALQLLNLYSDTALGVTSFDGDNLLFIVKELIGTPKLLKYPLLFVEGCIHTQERALKNLGLLYAMIRGFDREFAMKVVDAANNDLMTKVISNISGVSRFFANALQTELDSYQDGRMMLKNAVEETFPPLAEIDYDEEVEVMRPVRYLRVAILQMIPQIM